MEDRITGWRGEVAGASCRKQVVWLSTGGCRGCYKPPRDGVSRSVLSTVRMFRVRGRSIAETAGCEPTPLTAFRITPAIQAGRVLELAAGRARCARCLGRFRAWADCVGGKQGGAMEGCTCAHIHMKNEMMAEQDRIGLHCSYVGRQSVHAPSCNKHSSASAPQQL